jgi:hypothetical protein
MRYIQPQITNTLNASSNILGQKGSPVGEIHSLTDSTAYESDE